MRKSFSFPAPDLLCRKSVSCLSPPFLSDVPRAPACSLPAAQESARSGSVAPPPSARPPARRPCPSLRVRPCPRPRPKFPPRDRHPQSAGCARPPCVRPQSDLFTDVQHRRLIALAFANHNRSVDFHRVHRLAHCFHGHFIGMVPVAESHRTSRRNRRVFHHTQKIQAQLFFHPSLSSSSPAVGGQS